MLKDGIENKIQLKKKSGQLELTYKTRVIRVIS
jgi:hypothetical protein